MKQRSDAAEPYSQRKDTMLDFVKIKHQNTRSGHVEIYPDFRVGRLKDLMIRGNKFYAVWNYKTEMWSTDEYDVQMLVDGMLAEYAKDIEKTTTAPIYIRWMSSYSSSSWSKFKEFVSKLSDQSKQLDNRIIFSNTDVNKTDYISRKLSYPLEECPTPAFDALFGTLYSEEELTKLMWAIGSIVDGESKRIQKFFVLYGAPGTGKSTALNLIQTMFPGYYTNFEANALTSGGSNFSTEMFRENPLIGINHEGDLSRIKDNSLLNSVVAHDDIVMNIKYHRSYPIRLNTLLFIATNKPVSITDSKSGLIRRMIDIHPSGKKVSFSEYDDLVARLAFELGGIAVKCLRVFRSLGKSYYSRYKPVDMMFRTNVFYNYVDEHYYEFTREDFVTLSRAWTLYKDFCDNSNITYRLPRHEFRDEMKSYWEEFHPTKRIDGTQYRSVFSKFDKKAFSSMDEDNVEEVSSVETEDWLVFEYKTSTIDEALATQPAQYANNEGIPDRPWDTVHTTLSDIDTTTLHFVIPPKNHVVIDLDLRDGDGSKSLERNIEMARKFPPTYAELSKSGSGIHLHYNYEGETDKLSRIYDEGIDVLVPSGKFSIRRKLSLSNGLEVAQISSGLPLKKGNSMISDKVVKSEQGLRSLIQRNLYKGIHGATKPSMDFIDTILKEAYDSGLEYDVSDMEPAILTFASNSTNNPKYCIDLALQLPYKSEVESADDPGGEYKDERLLFYDVEVYENLFLICFKFEGEGATTQVMQNPSPEEVGTLLRYKLVGYNCRRYDNHILYARYSGYSIEDLYKLSQRIINGDRGAYFREAFKLSYVDVLDYASTKKTLKAWQVELGIFHMEMDIPWDEPVPKERIQDVIEYCSNDVISLEILHNHLIEDFHARQILSELSGLSVNSSTLSHTAKFIFGNDRNPQKHFVYPDLSLEFPGYKFDRGVSSYRDVEKVGEGGYVYSEPGIYRDVLYGDVSSMHPFSIINMNLFGKYTAKFAEIVEARMVVKRGDFDKARSMFGGVLTKYLTDKDQANKLAYALKIIINTVYGMTAASFDNPFRDHRNVDNVVAKRGALFMIDLRHALAERGSKCVHVKTDSVKIANSKDGDMEFLIEFGKRYGYQFSLEDRFSRMALIDKSQLIAKREDDSWYVVGATYKHPYVYKKLLSYEQVNIDDLIETREVRGGASMYLVRGGARIFVGKVGRFAPVVSGGYDLIVDRKGVDSAVIGTSGYKWLPYDRLSGDISEIDMRYFDALVDSAFDSINKLGDPSLVFNK